MNNFAVIISGPTGTGKTDFVEQLSLHLPIEIINADIGSFYKPLTIGTAKPDWQSSSIPHHFFDILDKPENWTAPQFREKLSDLMHEIWQRGNIPVVVGGSAFYIQSFFYKNHELPTPPSDLVTKLEMQDSYTLWKQLYEIDPDRADEIDPNDQYRLVRALAIWYTQHQKPSDFKQVFDPLSAFYFITLTRDRDQLYDMINQRVDCMIQHGWLNEVKVLLHDQPWVDFLSKKKMIGYNELLAYLSGDYAEQDFSDLIKLIAQRTRNYAKRQITFLKKLAINIQNANMHIKKFYVIEYNLSKISVVNVIKELICAIQQEK